MKRIFWLAIPIVLVALQLFNPSFENPKIDPTLDFEKIANPPAELLSTLKAACYDCHSNETKWPWYSKIAPVSFWVNNHVQEGREKLNFSEYGKPQKEGDEEVAETVQEGEMPLKSYTYLGMHPEAKLTQAQKQLIIDWFSQREGGSSEED
jgi:hypothetical protein